MLDLSIPGAPASWTRAQQLALAWTPVRFRAPLGAIFAAEALIGHMALTTPDPMLARIKLAWWKEQGLDSGSLEKLLPQQVNDSLTAFPKVRVALPLMFDAWDALCADWPPEQQDLRAFAQAHSEALAQAINAIFGDETDTVAVAAALYPWSLRHIARHTSTARVKSGAETLLQESMRTRGKGRLPRPVRVLARLAMRDGSERMPDIFTAARAALME